MEDKPAININAKPRNVPPPKENAWVTLATNDTYALGALVLAESLKKVGTRYQKCIMTTDGITQKMLELLTEVFDSVVDVNVLKSGDIVHLAMMERPELGITFTKIHCWNQTEYEKCVFLDADTLVLQNCDDLFEREELSAAPDVGWPDCFNSGVFVFRPNSDTFVRLVSFALDNNSFDGGDQGLLNLFFKNWSLEGPDKRLPFVYNMCSTACYSYIPAFMMFGSSAKIVHFIGKKKPWLFELNPVTGKVNPGEYTHLAEFLQIWWDYFIDAVLPKLDRRMAGLPGLFSSLTIGEERGLMTGCLEDHWRRVSWESGTADYLGRDSFEKVWEKIRDTMAAHGVVNPDDPVSSPESGSPEKREEEGRKSPPSNDTEKQSEDESRAEEPRAEDPKGVPQAAAPTPVTATQSLPSAPRTLEPLVDVDSSGASNLGSLAKTVSQAVASSLSSSELSLSPGNCALDALTVGQVVPVELPTAFSENLPSVKVAPIQALPPSDLILTEPSAQVAPIQTISPSDSILTKPSVKVAPIPALPPSDLIQTEPSVKVAPIQALPPSDLIQTEPSVKVAPIQALPPSDSMLTEPSAEPAAEQSALLSDDVLAVAALVQADSAPLVKGDPPLEPEPLQLPRATSPVQSVPRTPTVTEATPPTSPPIGCVGGFPLVPPVPSPAPVLAPAGAGAAASNEQVQPAPASQHSEPKKFDQ